VKLHKDEALNPNGSKFRSPFFGKPCSFKPSTTNRKRKPQQLSVTHLRGHTSLPFKGKGWLPLPEFSALRFRQTEIDLPEASAEPLSHNSGQSRAGVGFTISCRKWERKCGKCGGNPGL